MQGYKNDKYNLEQELIIDGSESKGSKNKK